MINPMKTGGKEDGDNHVESSLSSSDVDTYGLLVPGHPYKVGVSSFDCLSTRVCLTAVQGRPVRVRMYHARAMQRRSRNRVTARPAQGRTSKAENLSLQTSTSTNYLQG